MEVYLDHAATTPCYAEVAQKVATLMCDQYGNTSSLHKKGIEAERAVRRAREDVASLLKVDEKEIYFTSGGTESDNTAVFGAAARMGRRGRHIVTTSIEHPAVLESVRKLEAEGFAATYVEPDKDGVVTEQAIQKALRPDTILVSVMHVNNEIGSVQPLAEIGRAVKEYNKEIIYHSDCVQSFGKMLIRPRKWNLDMISVSGHKFHGPKGTGVLYVREGTGILPILSGGGHQRGMRPGTENVPAACGLALAGQMCYEHLDEKRERMYRLKERLAAGLEKIGDVHIQGSIDREKTAPHVLAAAFKNVAAEVLLHTLEENGVYVSSGSACSSNHPSVSHVLHAIQAPPDTLKCTIRFSLGESTTEEEIDYTLECLYNCVPRLRKFVRR